VEEVIVSVDQAITQAEIAQAEKEDDDGIFDGIVSGFTNILGCLAFASPFSFMAIPFFAVGIKTGNDAFDKMSKKG